VADDVQVRPRTHLGWSIVATALFFLPLGIPALVQSLRAQQAYGSGEAELGGRRGRSARRWAVAAIIVGIIVDAVIIAILLLLGAFGG
jgi:hypothetical protein